MQAEDLVPGGSDTFDLSAFQAFARNALAAYLGQSGRILYSAATTLQPGPLYILGLNPGGQPHLREGTIGDDLSRLPTRATNAYLDESWRGRAAGAAPLQRRLQWLTGALGRDLRDTCASNLIFLRSANAAGCQYETAADACWPVHSRILEQVQPRLLLVFGNSGVSPFRYLRDLYRPARVDAFDSGHGDWRCLAFRADGRVVVGVPHLSRYAVDRYPAVAAWIRAYASL